MCYENVSRPIWSQSIHRWLGVQKAMSFLVLRQMKFATVGSSCQFYRASSYQSISQLIFRVA